MGNQYLGLSLFIMLLSFFIVLTSKSEYKEIKAKSVLSSINMAFAANAVGENKSPSIQKAEKTMDTAEGNTLDKLRGVFASQFENFKMQENRFGTELFMYVPLEEFQPMMARLGPGMAMMGADKSEGKRTGLYDDPEDTLATPKDFMDTLVSLMRAEDRGEPYRLDMILKSPVSTLQERASLVDEVSGWARVIEGRGLPQRFLSAGVEGTDHQKEGVYLHFRRYEPVIISAASKMSGDELAMPASIGGAP